MTYNLLKNIAKEMKEMSVEEKRPMMKERNNLRRMFYNE